MDLSTRVAFSRVSQIRDIIDDVADVLGEGKRIDRYVELDSDGKFHLTTRNLMAIQSDPLPVLDEFTVDDVYDIIVNAIVCAIEHAEAPLVDSNTNDFIREATPEETFESWVEGPTGHIDIDGRTCYVQI